MPEWVVQVLGMAGVSVGAYAAIRADLAALRVIAEAAAKSADDAHRRIDGFLQQKGV